MDFDELFPLEVRNKRDSYIQPLLQDQRQKLIDWIAALRSDQYKQVTGVLKNDNGYCCMGVMCDLLNPDGWGEHCQTYGGWAYGFTYKSDEDLEVPPEDVMEYYGIDPNLAASFAALNDTHRLNFHQIADAIEWFFKLA